MARLSTLAMAALILFLVLSTTTTVEVEGEVYGGLRKIPKSNSKSETHERERKMMRSALFEEDYTDGEDYTDADPRKKCKDEPCEGKDDDYCLFEKRCGDCIYGKFCTEMYSS